MNKKIYDAVKNEKSDINIKYIDFENLIMNLGFKFQRQRGRTRCIIIIR